MAELPSAHVMEQKLIAKHITDAIENGLSKVQYSVFLCDSTVQWLETNGYNVKRQRFQGKPDLTTVSWLSNEHLLK